MYKDSPSDFLSCIVKNREGSNPRMYTEVWRQVTDQAVASVTCVKATGSYPHYTPTAAECGAPIGRKQVRE
eukprot:2000021-Prymnesium_polylepis.3